MNTGVLRVVQPGLHTTIQDLGRLGGQRFGIPVSGALDTLALRAANVVVGNPQATAGLEIAVMGPTLEIEADSVRLTAAGNGARLIVEPSDGSHAREVPQLQSARLLRGDRVRVGPAVGSTVTYLAIEGGFAIKPFMGSLSTYARGSFGGYHGRALLAGDCLPLAVGQVESRPEVCLDDFDLSPATEVGVVLGPQDDYFDPAAIEAFLNSTYTVSSEADRMGFRLEGPPINHAKGYNLVSDGIAPGSIQVPGSRSPIVLLADRQTTGGYPKIATVMSADLPAVGRLAPGAPIRFRAVSVAAAQEARRKQERMMEALPRALKPARGDGPDLDRLYDSNLVSGVIHAITP